MFEQYSVPSLAFCVDSVMSFYHNNLPSPPVPFHGDGLVVSFNTASTSVVPILDGKGLMSHAKRINWGASQATDYLLKLIQLKYPTFPNRVSSIQCNVRASSGLVEPASQRERSSGCCRTFASSPPTTQHSCAS